VHWALTKKPKLQNSDTKNAPKALLTWQKD
jgi:hypothetical protein